jgi:hypothetical protein
MSMNPAKYAAVAAVAVGAGVAATKPASAWDFGDDPNYGYGYGAFASGYPEVYGMNYPDGYSYVMIYPGGYEGYYRPYGYYGHRHHYYGYYGYYGYRHGRQTGSNRH